MMMLIIKQEHRTYRFIEPGCLLFIHRKALKEGNKQECGSDLHIDGRILISPSSTVEIYYSQKKETFEIYFLLKIYFVFEI